MMFSARIRLASLCMLVLASAPACHRASESGEVSVEANATAALNADLGADPFVEEFDDGTVAWRIDDSGEVKAAVSASTGARIQNGVEGKIEWIAPSGEAKSAPLVVDEKTGLLVATGPKLETELTQLNYSLTVSGKPWVGVLHVPVGGTAALVTSAKATAEVKLPDVGPHGGSIQVVGDDRLEMVADEGSGEVRVYVLDTKLEPVELEGRTLRVGFVAKTPETLVLAPATEGAYFVGRLGGVFDPLRITVSLGFHGTTHVALWGYRPGVRVIATTSARAPSYKIHVKGGFVGPAFEVHEHGHGHGHAYGRVEGGPDHHANAELHGHDRDHDHDRGGPDRVKVDIKDHDRGGPDKVKVDIKEHGGGGNAKAKVDVKASVGGGGKVSSGGKSGGGGKGRK